MNSNCKKNKIGNTTPYLLPLPRIPTCHGRVKNATQSIRTPNSAAWCNEWTRRCLWHWAVQQTHKWHGGTLTIGSQYLSVYLKIDCVLLPHCTTQPEHHCQCVCGSNHGATQWLNSVAHHSTHHVFHRRVPRSMRLKMLEGWRKKDEYIWWIKINFLSNFLPVGHATETSLVSFNSSHTRCNSPTGLTCTTKRMKKKGAWARPPI